MRGGAAQNQKRRRGTTLAASVLFENGLKRRGIHHSTEQTRVVRERYWMLLRRNMRPLSSSTNGSWGNFTVKWNLPQLRLLYGMLTGGVNTDSRQMPSQIAGVSWIPSKPIS